MQIAQHRRREMRGSTFYRFIEHCPQPCFNRRGVDDFPGKKDRCRGLFPDPLRSIPELIAKSIESPDYQLHILAGATHSFACGLPSVMHIRCLAHLAAQSHHIGPYGPMLAALITV